ncbi:MAG: phosphoenolpyruvate mutase [Candidatus Magasanikbacteria bacterium RIFOXYA2_FULL_44_8]|uniref:phosphoenolpyruvate mutase n=1 Tax=Candidatus Magasanikbacteria bacterium RIFOXYA2_FULL_44_8 TaxID=1798696 RepID=A0A1F6NL48_9BACT|nr:MAG: phosphoenolpyruvate mutase [Candidatus Magasanikbacteria bacterium RIFOXYA2_FULL_44_8]
MAKRIVKKNKPVCGSGLAAGYPTFCRIKKLKDLLRTKKIVRILEAHNGLTGLVVENTEVNIEGKNVAFDGMWESSLADALSKGKPDNAVVDTTSRIMTIHEILDVTTKPILVDLNNGGDPEHFGFTVRTMERMGVSAVVIEDKIGLKRNSLFGTDVGQSQDDVDSFCEKIKIGRASRATVDFMVIARIESLILKKGMDDALARAQAYIRAGADGILIHSKEKTPDEILEFCKRYKKITKTIPLVVVPTTYNTITEAQLVSAGVKMVIYANHLIRSAYPAMLQAAETILKNGRSFETDEFCTPIAEIINLIPFSDRG